jgi:hypothetical protein
MLSPAKHLYRIAGRLLDKVVEMLREAQHD